MEKSRILNGKVALVTGGGSGIGRATAILFAEQGAKVVVVDIVSERAIGTVQMILETGGEATFVKADVSKSADAENMVKATVEKYGKLDILFNNAGVYEYGSIRNTTEEVWDKVIDVNLKSVFVSSKYAIIQMMKQKRGVIVNTASECGVSGFPNLSAYCASKAGVHILTKAMAVELAPFNIRVNSVSPARIRTSMMMDPWKGLSKKEVEKRLKKTAESLPIGRVGKPEDIAYAVLYLSSDMASFVTGADLPVDGGATCTIVWGKTSQS